MHEQLFSATVPVFIRGLDTVLRLLDQGEQYAKQKEFDAHNLLQARLAPDMLNLIGQVQYAYFSTLEAAEQLAGKPQPKLSWDEKTYADVRESINRVQEHLRAIQPADFKDAEQKQVESFLRPGVQLSAEEYVRSVIVPNFFFHVTTAYDVLRHNGVPLGKDDYIGELPPAPSE